MGVAGYCCHELFDAAAPLLQAKVGTHVSLLIQHSTTWAGSGNAHQPPIHPPHVQAPSLDPLSLADALYMVAQHLHLRRQQQHQLPSEATTESLVTVLRDIAVRRIHRFDGKEVGLVMGALAQLGAVTPQVAAAAAQRAQSLSPGDLSPLYLLKLLAAFKAAGYTPSQLFTQAMITHCEQHVQYANPELMSKVMEALNAAAAGQNSTLRAVPDVDIKGGSGSASREASAGAGAA
jgi:hypothetical protein